MSDLRVWTLIGLFLGNRAMNQRKGVVLEERFQGRHRDPGPDLWRYLQDETCAKKKRLPHTKTLCNSLYGFLSLCYSTIGLQKLPHSGFLKILRLVI